MWIFGLGIVAMAVSSITMQMLCSGFALCEMCGWEAKGARYRLGMMLPAVGVLGAVFWKDMAVWIAVPTNIICGALLPIAYIAFLRMHRNRNYLKDDMPTGALAFWWTAGMVLSILVLVGFLGWFTVTKAPGWIEGLTG
jgi:hypothetical protein